MGLFSTDRVASENLWREQMCFSLINSKIKSIDPFEASPNDIESTFEECLDIYKSIEKWRKEPQEFLQLLRIFRNSGKTGIQNHVLRISGYFANVSGPRDFCYKNLYLFSVPKSGATFAYRVISEYLKLQGGDLSYFPLQTIPNTNIDYTRLSKSLSVSGKIFHSHAPFDSIISYFLRKNDIKPIVIVRDIFETIESMIDYHNQALIFSDYENVIEDHQFERKRGQRFGFFEDRQSNLQNGILMFAAVIVEFYSQWVKAQSVVWNPIFTYDFLKNDPKLFLSVVLKVIGAPRNEAKIEDIMSSFEKNSKKDPKRYNISRRGKGRGIQNFSKSQIELVRGFYKTYPDIDFSMIDKNLRVS